MKKQGNKKERLTESLHLMVNKNKWQPDIGLKNFT